MSYQHPPFIPPHQLTQQQNYTALANVSYTPLQHIIYHHTPTTTLTPALIHYHYADQSIPDYITAAWEQAKLQGGAGVVQMGEEGQRVDGKMNKQ